VGAMMIVFSDYVFPEEERMSKEELIALLKDLWKVTRDDIFIAMCCGAGCHAHCIDVDGQEFLRILERIKRDVEEEEKENN
jgi:hypothetical protein